MFLIISILGLVFLIINLCNGFIIINLIKKMIDKYYYRKLLEFPKKYYFGMENLKISKKEKLFLVMEDFLKDFQNQHFIVSLSGGVDSMVVLALLVNIIPKDRIFTASIDYNQRNESTSEINFLKKYLKFNCIKNYSIKVEGISRNKKDKNYNRKEFEETSREIRYELYNKIIKENNLDINKTNILLGHHRDDLRENIFNNFMLGRDLIDLEVMTKFKIKNNLRFLRPLLDYPKDEIYKISHKYNIPYFLDTTPKWSKRGLMRNELFPLLKKIYKVPDKSLDKQGENSNMLNVLYNKITDNFEYKKLNKNTFQIKIDNFKLSVENLNIWKTRLSKILHEEGFHMVSQKSLINFLNSLNIKKNIIIQHLSKDIKICFDKINEILILELKK